MYCCLSLSFTAPRALDCLALSYKVTWPVNVVITEACLGAYSRVFTFLLQLKRAIWTLKDIWLRLKRDGQCSACMGMMY